MIDSFFAEGARAPRTSKTHQHVAGLVERDQLFGPHYLWRDIPDVCEIPAAAWCTVVHSEVTP